MDLRDAPAAHRGFLQDLMRRRGLDPATFPGVIDPRDEMFFQAVLPGYDGDLGRAAFRYFESSLRTFDVYRQLAGHLGGFEALDRVLDFGSGWGRLTRCLHGRLPAERIWVSDIYANAVAWQAQTYGVSAVPSVDHPDGFALDGPFSIVFAASVFSHLPDPLFRGWLARLHGLVAPRGLLAFSVHPQDILPDAGLAPAGIAFQAWSESRSLDPQTYGMSYVTEAYVADAIREACGDAPYRRFPRGLFENQDLYVVGGEGLDLAGLDLRITPLGGVRPLVVEDGVVRLSGFGIDFNPGSQIGRVALSISGQAVAETQATADNTAALKVFPNPPNMPVQWRLEAPLGMAREANMLRVDLHSSGGETAYAYAALDPSQPARSPRT